MKIIYFLFFLLLFPVVSAVDLNITFEQQSQICGIMNFTFLECYELWNSVETAEDCSFNVTECPNETIYLDRNCTQDIEYKRAEWNHEEEIARINQNDSCVPTDCSEECRESVEKVKEQYGANSPPEDETFSGNLIFGLVFGMIVLFVVLYMFIKRAKSKMYMGMTRPTYDYSHSPPPMSSPPKPPEPPRPGDKEGADVSSF